MRTAAKRYGAGESDVERWGIAGMLHDADYERWPDEHPVCIVGWLEEAGNPRSPTRSPLTTPSGTWPTRPP